MPAPRGNENARRKGADWGSALKRALARYGNGDYRIALDQLADRIVREAIEKPDIDWDAVYEIGNRMDGKPGQAIAISGDGEGGPVEVQAIIKLVRPDS